MQVEIITHPIDSSGVRTKLFGLLESKQTSDRETNNAGNASLRPKKHDLRGGGTHLAI